MRLSDSAATATTLESIRRFIRLFARDACGNTMAIMAIALIPLTGLVGSGIDLSRTYMVRARLQQSCDAGALAGRRAMSGITLDANSTDSARKFFTQNFPAGQFGSTNVVFTPTATADGQVAGTAVATVPMMVMSMFGVNAIPLSVTCEAKLEISNTDIVFVLDVSGTMTCAAVDTAATCLNNGSEKTNAKIKALRTAVLSFYDTISGNISSTARLRIGFVPYSSTVNVSGVIPTTWLVDNFQYQSRVADYTTMTALTATTTNTQESYASNITNANCTKYAANTYPTTGTNPIVSGTAPATVTSTTYSAAVWAKVSGSGSSALGTCKRSKKVVATPYGYSWTKFTNQPVTYNVSDLKLGNSVNINVDQTGTVPVSGTYNPVQLATAMGVGAASTWKGCIEERDSLPSTSFTTTPATALHDMNIDELPTSQATRWRPKWGDVVFSGNNNPKDSCPKAMSKLDVMTRLQVANYISASNGFVADGATYHDVGILWAARLMSPTGIFSNENTTAPNGKPISRHIIYMTDGEMRPDPSVYTAYGLESLDRRIMGTTTPTLDNTKDRHNLRFTAICNQARAKNITMWVVDFATALTSELTGCADPGKALLATTDDDLNSQFIQIADRISELRLSR